MTGCILECNLISLTIATIASTRTLSLMPLLTSSCPWDGSLSGLMEILLSPLSLHRPHHYTCTLDLTKTRSRVRPNSAYYFVTNDHLSKPAKEAECGICV
ncbi:hypothetical protein BX616_003931 [Lobosporangium transversale]|nr:hypothetical protein BX616_003931 [Lobosporangium transversale]